MRVLIALAMIAGCSYEPPSIPSGPQPTDGSSTDASQAADGPSTDGPPIDSPQNQVTCPGTMCGPFCCDGVCSNVALGACVGTRYDCDGPEDCNPGQTCCNNQNGSTCVTSGTCNGATVCHTFAADCNGSGDICVFDSSFGQQICKSD